jgi:hypothetical protein
LMVGMRWLERALAHRVGVAAARSRS